MQYLGTSQFIGYIFHCISLVAHYLQHQISMWYSQALLILKREKHDSFILENLCVPGHQDHDRQDSDVVPGKQSCVGGEEIHKHN